MLGRVETKFTAWLTERLAAGLGLCPVSRLAAGDLAARVKNPEFSVVSASARLSRNVNKSGFADLSGRRPLQMRSGHGRDLPRGAMVCMPPRLRLGLAPR